MSKILFTSFALCMISLSMHAQLSINAEMRSRFEIRNGYRNPEMVSNQPVAFISQRSRLSIKYLSDNFKLCFSPQDVRIWGDEDLSSSTGVYGDKASLSLFEGYAEINTIKAGWISIGRQQLIYDQQRLLAARNWNQHGLAYDAIIWKITNNFLNIHIGTSWNSKASTLDNSYPIDRIKSLNFIWANYCFNTKLKLSALHITSGKTKTDSTATQRLTHTSGYHAEYKSKQVFAYNSFYFQYGNNIQAYLTDTKISWTPNKFNLTACYSYLSGDNNLSDNTNTLFDNLYGARHRYFGHMDYFRSMADHTNSGGLEDYSISISYAASKRAKATYTMHYMRLAQLNETCPIKADLGVENEFNIQYSINEAFKIKTSWIIYSATDNFKELKKYDSNKTPQFFFIELNVNSNLFKQKNPKS